MRAVRRVEYAHVDTHVSRIRDKLELAPENGRRLSAV
jgi:endonuclease III